MGDILSQNEIDELLQQLNTGEIDVKSIKSEPNEKKIKEHDFRRPSKFAKDHIRTLQIINENYSRLVTNFLSGYLRALVQVDVLSVEALQYSEFTNSIANPTMLAIVDFSPLPGSIIMDISPSIAYVLIDRILGGQGFAMERVRGFTEIERAIMERIINQILGLMKEPWENVIALKPRLDRIETNAQFVQIMSPNEMVALITLSVKVGDVEGFMNICIPHMVVEPIMPKLSTKLWFSMIEKGTSNENKAALVSRVEETRVPLVASLGKTNIMVSEFLQLQIGDVLQLNTGIDSELEVKVGEIHKFQCKPGVKNKKVAIKITNVLIEEED